MANPTFIQMRDAIVSVIEADANLAAKGMKRYQSGAITKAAFPFYYVIMEPFSADERTEIGGDGGSDFVTFNFEIGFGVKGHSDEVIHEEMLELSYLFFDLFQFNQIDRSIFYAPASVESMDAVVYSESPFIYGGLISLSIDVQWERRDNC